MGGETTRVENRGETTRGETTRGETSWGRNVLLPHDLPKRTGMDRDGPTKIPKRTSMGTETDFSGYRNGPEQTSAHTKIRIRIRIRIVYW